MDPTMKVHARALAVLAALALAGLASAAPIDPGNREEAQARFERGREFFEEGDFSAALVEFRRANEMSPNFRLHYNIGQVCYQLQDYPCALQSFAKYLSEGGAEVPAARVGEVQREMEKLKVRVARVVVSTNVPGAEISVDDVPVGKTPLGAALVVSAGRRRVSASLKGYLPATKTIEVAGMELSRMTLDLTPMGAAEPVTRTVEREPTGTTASSGSSGSSGSAESAVGTKRREEAAIQYKRPSPWLWAIPGALVAGGVSMGIWAQRESKAMVARQSDLTTPVARLEAMNQNTKAYALVSDLLTGAGIVSAVVLGVLTLFPPVEPSSGATSAALSLGVGPGGVSVAGHF